MGKPDRLSAALNGPRGYPPLSAAMDSRLTFRKLRRPTPLPAFAAPGVLQRGLQWLLGSH